MFFRTLCFLEHCLILLKNCRRLGLRRVTPSIWFRFLIMFADPGREGFTVSFDHVARPELRDRNGLRHTEPHYFLPRFCSLPVSSSSSSSLRTISLLMPHHRSRRILFRDRLIRHLQACEAFTNSAPAVLRCALARFSNIDRRRRFHGATEGSHHRRGRVPGD